MSRTAAPIPTEPDRCPRGFPEELVSGYIDRVLTQGDLQRVKLHLEDCASCRDLHRRLHGLREVTLGTEIAVPDDGQWDERPRGRASRWLRLAGWVLLVLWILALAGTAVYHLARTPASLWETVLALGGVAGVACIFLSILVDRLRRRGDDRYRKVLR